MCPVIHTKYVSTKEKKQQRRIFHEPTARTFLEMFLTAKQKDTSSQDRASLAVLRHSIVPTNSVDFAKLYRDVIRYNATRQVETETNHVQERYQTRKKVVKISLGTSGILDSLVEGITESQTNPQLLQEDKKDNPLLCICQDDTFIANYEEFTGCAVQTLRETYK